MRLITVLPTAITLPLTIFAVVAYNIIPMMKTGFSVPAVGFLFATFYLIIFGITMLIPIFRQSFYRITWLYPFCVTLLFDLIILSIAEVTMSIGCSVHTPARRIIGIVIAIVVFVLGRFLMSMYFKKKPLEEEDTNE